jgi:hypothetical protein
MSLDSNVSLAVKHCAPFPFRLFYFKTGAALGTAFPDKATLLQGICQQVSATLAQTDKAGRAAGWT